MKTDLPTHTGCKDSGADWLGLVPDHWETKALKRETPVLRGASPRPIDNPTYFDDDGEYSWVRISDVTAAGVYLDETEQRLSSLGASLSVKMQPGSLFLSIAGSVGKPCITRIKCCIHDGFVYFPKFKGETKFLFYVFASGEPYRGLGKLGTQLNLNTDTVASIIVGVPPVAEQRQIVAFLDRETAKIDRLMEVRRKQIERLQEQRTAVIHHAVTKGLDPNAKMKPSGVEWLGEVNCTWLECDIKHVAEVIAGGTPKSSEYDFWDGDVVWLTPTDLGKENARNIDGSARTITALGQTAAGLALLPAGSLVLSTRAPVGSMGILAVPATTNQGCKGMVFDRDKADGRFFFYLLSLAVPYLNAAAQGATFVELSGYQLKNLPIACPDTATQQVIADWLDREMNRFDTLASKYNRELELLAEYRASLISHAVTGKIDVRGLVPTESAEQS